MRASRGHNCPCFRYCPELLYLLLVCSLRSEHQRAGLRKDLQDNNKRSMELLLTAMAPGEESTPWRDIIVGAAAHYDDVIKRMCVLGAALALDCATCSLRSMRRHTCTALLIASTLRSAAAFALAFASARSCHRQNTHARGESTDQTPKHAL